MRRPKQTALMAVCSAGSFGMPQKYGLGSRGAIARQTLESTDTSSLVRKLLTMTKPARHSSPERSHTFTLSVSSAFRAHHPHRTDQPPPQKAPWLGSSYLSSLSHPPRAVSMRQPARRRYGIVQPAVRRRSGIRQPPAAVRFSRSLSAAVASLSVDTCT
eukprot:SAG31_NODE_11162_length_1059_cov_1.529167_1_plen_159_part_00